MFIIKMVEGDQIFRETKPRTTNCLELSWRSKSGGSRGFKDRMYEELASEDTSTSESVIGENPPMITRMVHNVHKSPALCTRWGRRRPKSMQSRPSIDVTICKKQHQF